MPEIPKTNWQRRVVDRSLSKATQRSLDRGAALIEAAARLMERTKGDTFTVQDVANEAGQSLRSFYQHFGSKDDLFLAVFEEAMRIYAMLLLRDIDRYDKPLDRLIAGVISVAHLTRRSSQGIVVVLSRLRMQLTEVDPQLVASSTSPVTSALRDLVERGPRRQDGWPVRSGYCRLFHFLPGRLHKHGPHARQHIRPGAAD